LTHTTIKVALQIAFKMATYQINCPSWMEADRYDILATIPASTTNDEALAMLRNFFDGAVPVAVPHRS
jgi:uncharacterized protein (TIGR03435 family)